MHAILGVYFGGTTSVGNNFLVKLDQDLWDFNVSPVLNEGWKVIKQLG